MRVAIFTDNDFNKVNGVTTTLRAVLEHAPEDIDARIYTCNARGLDTADCLSLAAVGFGIPFYREMKLYLPSVRRLMRHVIADGAEVVHLTTPGPVGLAALFIARRLGLPMIGSFHTDLEAYARLLSGSERLATLMGYVTGHVTDPPMRVQIAGAQRAEFGVRLGGSVGSEGPKNSSSTWLL